MQGVDHARALLIATTMAFTIVMVPACGTSHPTAPEASGALTPVALADDWPIATPAEAGLDVARMTDLVQRLRAGGYGRIASLLVVRDGRLVSRSTSTGGRSAEGRTAEAVQLEQLCGELAHDVDILCLYPVPYTKDDRALECVCAEHTAVSAS